MPDLLRERLRRPLRQPAARALFSDSLPTSEEHAMPVTTTLHDQIDGALRGDLDAKWNQVLDQWEDGGPAQKKAITAYVSGLRNRMLRILTDLDDAEEAQHGLAIQYIEVKCHWMMLNMQIQSQTARNGRAQDNLIYRATCVSLIIEAMEPLLSRDRVDTLTGFLAEPLQ